MRVLFTWHPVPGMFLPLTPFARASFGLPMVIVPLGADQPDNAARCAELGASRTLDPSDLRPEVVRETVLDVLQMPSYRQAAARLRAELDGLPGPKAAVVLLERLARDREPLVAGL
jgi:UDP:flavonoid glycosyltransferase YjiC (YdhE family)